MTDKEKIKEEIESYKESMKGLKPHSDFRRGQITAYNQIMQFINSLPEEPASEDLEEEIEEYFKGWQFDDDLSIMAKPNHYFADFNDIKDIARHFAEWGRNHFEDKSEMVSDDLENAAIAYSCANPSERSDGMYDQTDIEWAFEAGAEWQKQKDQETIELAEDHAMLAGMNKMKEEMMENAVDAVVYQGLYSKYVKESDDEALANVLKNHNSGDKVKIIIVKTEQQ